MIQQRLNSRLSGLYVLVAPHTQIQTRNACRGRLVRGPVAIATVQAEFTGMEGVIEGNRLLIMSSGIRTAF